MGTKHSKMEGSYLPDTPDIQSRKLSQCGSNSQIETQKYSKEDPRSPTGCRTPLSCITQTAKHSQQVNQMQLYQNETATNFNENSLGALRRRFLKGFSYNLNDPRSPSSELNRTPLIFDENDRTFNMDDTFADLFIETRKTLVNDNECYELEKSMKKDEKIAEISETNNSECMITSFDYAEEETMPCETELPQTPNTSAFTQLLQGQSKPSEIDPRSPTLGLERTPILISDDNEVGEEAVLENILATLSFNATSSSDSSFGTPKCSTTVKYSEIKPTNKHLESVRTGRKRFKTTQKLSKQNKKCIYEDIGAENNPKTPKQKIQEAKRNVNSPRRTPLSCVKNISKSSRSRSVEISEKSLKTRISLSSYDDILNPKECFKITDLQSKLQDNKEKSYMF